MVTADTEEVGSSSAWRQPNVEIYEEAKILTVSVVIPTHNRADLFRKALDSVLCQTYPPLEVIVVDDASDNPSTYAAVRGLQDVRVRYVRSEQTLGPSGARNRGIHLSSGELVAFLDDDDEWLPEKLERQVREFASDPAVGAVYCLCKWSDVEDGKPRPQGPREYAHGWIFAKQLIDDYTCGTPTYIVRRSLLLEVGCFDTSLLGREDWDLTIRLASRCKIALVNDALVVAGVHNRPGVSKRSSNLLDAERRILLKYALARRRLGSSVDRKAKSRYYASGGQLYCYMGKRVMGAYFHICGILVWPFFSVNYSGFLKAFIPSDMRRALSKMRQ